MAACSAAVAALSIGSRNNNPSTRSKAQQHNNLMDNQQQTKCWQQRLLGNQLIRCTNIEQKLSCTDLLKDKCEILGFYFSFIDKTGSCDDFTRHLIDLYDNVNRDKKSYFEIVHIVLWSNEVLDFDESFRGHVNELPWLAVPCDDYERKVSFAREIYELNVSFCSVKSNISNLWVF